MASSDAATVVRAVFTAFAGDDVAAALGHYAEDVVIRQAPGTPWSGTFVGHAGFHIFTTQLFAVVSRLEILETVIIGDDARAVVLETLRLSRSGAASIDVEAIEVFVVRAGLVRRVDVWYRDPPLVSAWLAAPLSLAGEAS
jgi:ketosteroid isomerase-like protein